MVGSNPGAPLFLIYPLVMFLLSVRLGVSFPLTGQRNQVRMVENGISGRGFLIFLRYSVLIRV